MAPMNSTLQHQADWRNRSMAFILTGALLMLTTANPAAATWTAAIKPDPLTRQVRCLLSSDPQITSDGYDSTPVTLVFNGTSLAAITESELDLSFNDVQLVVDKDPPFQSDRLEHQKMTLVFDQDIPGLIQKLRTGKQVTVYLRFWPTWPVTELFSVKFNLAGFSKAHDSMVHGCQPLAPTRSATPLNNR